jgi:hypothetical protein
LAESLEPMMYGSSGKRSACANSQWTLATNRVRPALTCSRWARRRYKPGPFWGGGLRIRIKNTEHRNFLDVERRTPDGVPHTASASGPFHDVPTGQMRFPWSIMGSYEGAFSAEPEPAAGDWGPPTGGLGRHGEPVVGSWVTDPPGHARPG